MIRLILLTALFVLQSCAGGSPDSNPAPSGNSPPTTRPESGSFFSDVDQEIAPSAVGDRFITERFYVLMSRLSVYALICDAKNDRGYSTRFSNLWNRSVELRALAEKVYGSEKAAYNRLEKQRNIESRRLSFESGPNVCELSRASFTDYVDLSADELSTAIRTSPRGTF